MTGLLAEVGRALREIASNVILPPRRKRQRADDEALASIRENDQPKTSETAMPRKVWYIFILVIASAFLLFGLYQLLLGEFRPTYLSPFVFWGIALWFAISKLRSPGR
jgi:hypothetical protein